MISDSFVQDHASLVTRIAADVARRVPRQVPRGDLIAWGLTGLYDAAKRFDPSKATFATFARCRIRGAILDGLRSCDTVSRGDRTAFRHVERATDTLASRLGRQPHAEEIASALGVPLAEWHALRVRLAGAGLIPERRRRHRDFDRISCACADGYDAALNAERRSMLDRAITTLPARHQAVILLYYRRGLTMKEIGAELGVNESRVSQIHRAALGRLKREIDGGVTGVG